MQLQPIEEIFALIEDGEVDEAIKAVDAHIVASPSLATLHALRAFLLTSTGRHTEASTSVERALQLDDSDPYIHRAAAEVALALHEPTQAIAAAHRVRELDPDDDEGVILDARARLMLGQWDEVIARTSFVIGGNAEHEAASMLRAIAQELKAGDRAPFGTADWEKLAERFPVNPTARTGHAWALLQRGKSRAAGDQFRQALTLEPGSPWANEGLVLALKAKYPGYGLLLRYFFWASRLTERMGWWLAIGGFLGYRMLYRAARANPELQPYVYPILIAYGLFVLSTWLADPLLNLVLSVHREGRTVLSEDDRMSGKLVGAALATGIALAASAATMQWSAGVFAGITIALSSLTVSGAYRCAEGKYRTRLLQMAGGFCALAVAAALLPEALGVLPGFVAFIGTVASTWFARSWIPKSHDTA